MMVLEASNISKSYVQAEETIYAVRDVSLELERGEIVSLEGPSGSGKTTLLSILGCILTPSAGVVKVNGNVVENNQKVLAGIRRKNIGFVFQQFNLFPSLTALENVAYSLHVKKYDKKHIKKESMRAIAAVGLLERKDFLPRDLSGGQKQRVAIARAFAGSPPILLADEPTCNLDEESALSILSLFHDLAKSDNRALVIVTHDPKVRRVCDRVMRINNGKVADNITLR